MEKIFSVSVTYNPDLDLLNRQIDSLCNQVYCITIVDNGSLDITQLKDYLSNKQFEIKKEFIIVYNDKNIGLGSAQNIGIKAAIENSASDVLLLDQDSVLKADFVSNIFAARHELLNKKIKVGAIGPVYYNEVTQEMYPITRFWGPFIERIKPSEKPEEASFLIASGCFININVLKEVGLMDEKLFIDCIDVDWSFRARAMGYKLFASPKVMMMHTIGEKRLNIGGRSIAVHSPFRRYYLFRNSVFMVKNKNIPIGYKIREIVFNTLRLIVYFTVSTERIKYLKYSFNGFKDGIRGVGGECPYKF
ncbi:MAG: rhamnosyltransferase [Mucilaginibacter sp.]|uniref:rhamnosyltransferase n=1 Tax=Mucilaginibacter sp. TaxID=1882438 RepID=UPI0034E5BC15